MLEIRAFLHVPEEVDASKMVKQEKIRAPQNAEPGEVYRVTAYIAASDTMSWIMTKRNTTCALDQSIDLRTWS